jgi:23S rRNA pseudouridine1911/1915/1917 synthase
LTFPLKKGKIKTHSRACIETNESLERLSMKKNHSSSNKKILFQTTFQEPTTQPLIDFLKKSSPISGRSLSKYFFKGRVLLNNRPAHSQANIKLGDTVTVFEIDFEYQALTPETMPLDIVYEDNQMLVINKPAHLVVHPVKDILTGTLANGVAAYFKEIDLPAKVRPVNRLDSGTSGLVIFAKNALTQDALSEAIRRHQILRIYYAVVKGIPGSGHGIIDAPIGANKGRRFVTEHGRPAETHFQIIERFTDACLLELTLKTGRTHQIRVHLNQIHCPIIGDRQYGVISTLITRQALHAGKLNFTAASFPIPELSAPFPADFQKLLDGMRIRKNLYLNP